MQTTTWVELNMSSPRGGSSFKWAIKVEGKTSVKVLRASQHPDHPPIFILDLYSNKLLC